MVVVLHKLSEESRPSPSSDIVAADDDSVAVQRPRGHLGRIVAAYEQVMAERERELGAEHPDTLAIGHNLALACQAVGDHDRAKALFEQVMALRERVLGPGHPDTLAIGHNLALAYQAVGDHDRAEALFERSFGAVQGLVQEPSGDGEPV
ncbi:tetratricopeptide repeat protein [Actinomadura soli]|uniref:tetratricopeptide repeat protein n=1 Tax=Actinomadura soli TaxID=2508997 RepID=UPI0022A6D68E|nr:tetratricopeptide repeat protein [Actinomadura soli]